MTDESRSSGGDDRLCDLVLAREGGREEEREEN
jgi:hypothetical protein